MRVRKRVTIFILLSAIIIAYIVRVTVEMREAWYQPHLCPAHHDGKQAENL